MRWFVPFKASSTWSFEETFILLASSRRRGIVLPAICTSVTHLSLNHCCISAFLQLVVGLLVPSTWAASERVISFRFMLQEKRSEWFKLEWNTVESTWLPFAPMSMSENGTKRIGREKEDGGGLVDVITPRHPFRPSYDTLPFPLTATYPRFTVKWKNI